MALSDILLATAQRLLRLYGQSVSFARVSEGAFIPSSGSVGAGTSSSFSAYGAPSSYSFNEINNETIMQDDVLLTIEVNASGSVPAVGDVATVSGQAYRVLRVEKLVVQGVTVAYKLQVRI